MLLVRSDTLPEGRAYELKLDGYRALGLKSYGVAHLLSRNNESFRWQVSGDRAIPHSIARRNGNRR